MILAKLTDGAVWLLTRFTDGERFTLGIGEPIADAIAPYWVDDEHVWRFDVDNPGPDDAPRPVGWVGHDSHVSDAMRVALADVAKPAADRRPCQCAVDEWIRAYERFDTVRNPPHVTCEALARR